jgi:phosphoglycolate phosphatase
MNLYGPDFEIKGVNHIIFDKDGTITDAHVYWSEIIRRRSKAICKVFDLPLDLYEAKLQVCMGLGFDGLLSPTGPIAIKSRYEVIQILINMLKLENILTNKDQIDQILISVHREFSSVSHKYIKPIDTCLAFIAQLSKVGIALSLATSDSLENTKTSLEMLKLYTIFSPGIACFDSGFGDKKNGEPARALCRMRGFSPSETICIGDAPMDLLMSETASLKACILVSTGQIPFVQLKSVTSFACRSLSEILISP